MTNTADIRKAGALSGQALEATMTELDRLHKARAKALQVRAKFPEAPHDKYEQGVRDAALWFLEAAGE
jgi:hypothetical protein